MTSAPNQWLLPGQVDPLISPCAFCRRRLVVGGKQVFKSCSCKAFGPPVTIAALVGGAVLAAAGWWWASRQRGRRD
ncbi:hypothetical protein QMK33_16570 [Hymenobacter sp. H14-R3]|uniref:hypothetical protein n=1 Tax=Hymenobacter sp. H14-R3 TaxID=3046308 RepID=UPI0024BACFB5|nr:hypothetical protein [Hymenobacter sp. H14-R3]MDJ0366770.1 hypothetical protein [Hymenobacter sp. H14-R3]